MSETSAQAGAKARMRLVGTVAYDLDLMLLRLSEARISLHLNAFLLMTGRYIHYLYSKVAGSPWSADSTVAKVYHQI